MKRIFIIFAVLFFQTNIAKAQEPTIATCVGEQTFCLTQNTFDLCVEITLNSDFTDPIDHFEVDWGDGSPIITIPNSSNPIVSPHTFDFSNFYNTCNYDEEYFIKLTTYIVNGPPVANIIPITFLNPPQAIFSINPNPICVGEEACFNDNSCPTQGLEILSWDYGDGTPAGLDDCHVYNQVGTYNVTLIVENYCGTATITHQLEVINPAESNPTMTSNNVDMGAIPFIYCLGSGLVDLDGDSLSLNENYYEWQSLNSVSGASWVVPLGTPNPNDATPNIPDLSVSFTDTGLYQIILEVDNDCDQPDFDTLFIQVLTGEALSQPSQPDACLTLEYTPDNFNPNATYTINGMVETNFPITLGIGNYTVVCSLTNECGSQTTTDNFEVFDEENVSILFPTMNTTICVDSDSILILYSPTGGIWTGEHLTIYGDSVFFHPVEIGSFEITYSKGVGDCADSESIIFTVEDSGVTTTDFEVCSVSDPFPMGGTPLGGTYTCTDCPLCIQGDTFVISQMVALGLTSVEVNYSASSTSGCDGNNIFTVTIENPLADFEVENTFCSDDPVTVDFSNAVGTLTWMLDGQNVNPPPFLGLSSGNHTIKLTAEAGDCDTTETQTITIVSVPDDVNFTATPLEGCAPLEVTLTNLTSSFDNEAYEWYINDELFSTAIQPGTITLDQGLSDTTYTIKLTAGNSCAGEEVIEVITVFPRPVPRFGPMQNHYCSGDTVTFSNVSFGGPMTSWLWDYGNGTTSTDSIPLEIIYFTDTIPSNYTVSLTATNDCGTETFTYDLVINPTDVKAFFNIDPIEGCVGVPVCLTNLSTLGAAVLWDFGDGNTSTQFNLCHTYQQAGNYTITLKAYGCGFDSIQFEVVIHPMPDAGFSNNTITCPGDTLSFTNSSNLADDFLWDFGDGSTSMLNNPTHVYNISGNYVVKLYATSTEGCVDSTTSNITVLIPPTANFTTSTDSICENQNIVFTSISNPNPLTCFWDFGDGSFSNDCIANHSFDTTGNYMVTLIVTDTNGCRDTTQQLINVAAVPSPAFDYSPNQDCSPVIIAFINQTILGESYVWDFGDGSTSMATTPTHTYSNGGNFTIQLTANNGVCSATTSQIISINPTPNAEIIAPLGQVGCAEFNAAFTASPMGNNYNYKWDFGDGSFSFDANPLHPFNTAGIFEVVLMVEDDSCADTTSLQIEVFEPVEADIITVDNLCFGDAMGNIDLVITNGTANYQFDWSNGVDTEDNPSLPAGNYSFTITDNNQCTLSETVEITQPDAPLSIHVLQEKIVTCYGGSDGALTIEAEGGTPDYTYLWEMGNTSTSIENVPAGEYNITITDANNCVGEEILAVNQNDSISYNAMVSNISCFGFEDGQINLDSFSGGVAPYFATLDTLSGTGFNNLAPNNYVVIISDGVGCTQIFNTNILEPLQIFIELDEDSVLIQLGETFEITSDYNVANPTFTWTPAKWLDCPTCDKPVASPWDDITYAVLMVDENGCFDLDSIFIEVNDERGIAIPNIFSPNNDGENDIFKLRGKNPAVVEVTAFRIFDRHGGIMYEARNFPLNDPSFGWDGKYKGTDVQAGNYIYTALIKYVDGKEVEWKGSIMLIR